VNSDETVMEFTSSIIFGSSGGGIYNSKGELVGIGNAIKVARLRGRMHPVPHRAMGIPIPAILKEIGQTKYKFILNKGEISEDNAEWPDDWPDDWPDFPGLDIPDPHPLPPPSRPPAKKWF
jgi:hypothetical protein